MRYGHEHVRLGRRAIRRHERLHGPGRLRHLVVVCVIVHVGNNRYIGECVSVRDGLAEAQRQRTDDGLRDRWPLRRLCAGR